MVNFIITGIISTYTYLNIFYYIIEKVSFSLHNYISGLILNYIFLLKSIKFNINTIIYDNYIIKMQLTLNYY